MKKALMIAAASLALAAGAVSVQPAPASATVRLYLDFGGPRYHHRCYSAYRKVRVGTRWSSRRGRWVPVYRWRWVRICR